MRSLDASWTTIAVGRCTCILEGFQMDLDLEQRKDGMYSGTFRWTEHKQFPALPTRSAPPSWSSLTGGWQGYLSGSHEVNLIPWATTDPSFLDALSFPMTLLHLTMQLSLDPLHVSTILVIGATVKAEQRVWCNTDYWNEIAAFYPDQAIQLWFIGPEVIVDCAPKSHCKLTVHCYRGTTGDFLSSHRVDVHTTVIIGYNTGFGNFVESNRHDLLWSWLPDLYTIAASGILAIFACANDYADMNGEFAIHSRVVGSKFVYLPKDNPFSAASHLHEEGKQNTSWSRANSFVYAIQGYDPARQSRVAAGDLKHLTKLLEMDVEDLHLIDRVGRHYFRGMILSEEQAAKSNLLGPSTTPKASKPSNPSKGALVHQPSEKQAKAVPNKEHEPNAITPKYELISSLNDTKMKIIVQIPALATIQATDLQVSSDQVLFTAPGTYHLRLDLPWRVDVSKTVPKFSKRDRVLLITLEK